jgi:hypothetical protein
MPEAVQSMRLDRGVDTCRLFVALGISQFVRTYVRSTRTVYSDKELCNLIKVVLKFKLDFLFSGLLSFIKCLSGNLPINLSLFVHHSIYYASNL